MARVNEQFKQVKRKWKKERAEFFLIRKSFGKGTRGKGQGTSGATAD
jgi:hypothetical protein